MTQLDLTPGVAVPAPAAAAPGLDLTGGDSHGEGGRPSVRTPRVCGVDLSLTSTGLACTAGLETVTSHGHKGDDLASRGARLRSLRTAVIDWCRTADLVVIEAPAFSRVQGSSHDRSGLWWLIVSRLASLGIPVAEVAPTGRAKYATGKGNADKETVLLAAVKRFPMYEISNNNEADALVLLAMGLDQLGQPIVVMPDTHRTALAAVRWPELIAS